MEERKNRGPLVLLTDFGYSHYVGILKGVILSYNPDTLIVDLTHSITPFKVVEASYALYTSYKYFPKGSIFLAVVDPGVGTERDILITEYKDYIFIAPDNGLLSPFLDEGKNFKFTSFDRLGEISNTFHGRDVFAPIAALISTGESPKDIGTVKKNPVKIEWWRPEKIDQNTYQGIILFIDRFNNAITNIPCDYINKIDKIRIKGIIIKDKFPSFGHAPYDTPFIYCGSSKFIEIGLREEGFAKKYDITLLSPLLCFIK